MKIKEGVLELYTALWHTNSGSIWVYLGPALDSWQASLASRRLVGSLVREVCSSCEICQRVKWLHGKLAQQPRATGVVARVPDEWVVGDVTECMMANCVSVKFIHLMDAASRWPLVVVIRGSGVKAKDAATEIAKWVFHFGGPPGNFLFDNGREFIGKNLV